MTHSAEHCPVCACKLPLPMISPQTADAKARLDLLADFEVIVLIPKAGKKLSRTIDTRFLLTAPLEVVKRMTAALIDIAHIV